MLSLLALLFAFICGPCRNGAALAAYHKSQDEEDPLSPAPEVTAYRNRVVGQQHAKCRGESWCDCQHAQGGKK